MKAKNTNEKYPLQMPAFTAAQIAAQNMETWGHDAAIRFAQRRGVSCEQLLAALHMNALDNKIVELEDNIFLRTQAPL